MTRGTAVLVHGGWSNPDDWCWVAERLRRHDVAVEAPDLPSHQGRSAGRAEDVAAVRDVVASASGAVVVVGWSYGGAVLSDLVPTPPSVTRLIYVASVPQPISPPPGGEPPSIPTDLSNLLFPDDATVVLDDEWWLTEGDASTFRPDVVDHLRSHRRRPFTTAAILAPPTAEAWRQVPTTLLLGRSDELVPSPLQEWAQGHLDDVRLVDGDHFLIFQHPDTVVDVIMESF